LIAGKEEIMARPVQQMPIRTSGALSVAAARWLRRDGGAQHRFIDAAQVPVVAAMSCDINRVTLEVSVEALAGLFLDEQIEAVPVVDGRGFPVGMVSRNDLARNLGGASGLADLATPTVHSVRNDQSLAQAAGILARHHLHYAPVVDAAGRCIGMISSFDLVRFIAGSDD
jgi:CBS-domain-containing membrane protein